MRDPYDDEHRYAAAILVIIVSCFCAWVAGVFIIEQTRIQIEGARIDAQIERNRAAE